MLAACENLTKIAVLPSGQRHSSRGLPPTSAQAGTSDLRSTLLQTILSSSTFTSDDVFRIARYIFHDIATRSYIETSRGEDTSTELVHAPLQVTNAFLHVCAVTGHFDEASAVLEDMMGRAQGDVKPDLTTYRNVLRAAHVHRQQLQKQGVDTGDLDIKVDNIIDRAAEALAKQTRMALRIKLGLGALIGATVGKFTMMGILALPPLRFMGEVEEPKLEEHSTAMETSLPVDGIIHYMESHELAMGVGLAVGILTAGYFIRGSTRHSRIVSEQDPTPKSRSKDSRSSIGYRNALQDLPRAKLLGLYFPDLPTTNLDEIRENLRSNMKV
ncbi:hypothetical protein BGX31_011358 [Mortierella sp. GBA43]|nr:hypothetical protein BGX31_011358 [Mortierella sp. GBA43]